MLISFPTKLTTRNTMVYNAIKIQCLILMSACYRNIMFACCHPENFNDGTKGNKAVNKLASTIIHQWFIAITYGHFKKVDCTWFCTSSVCFWLVGAGLLVEEKLRPMRRHTMVRLINSLVSIPIHRFNHVILRDPETMILNRLCDLACSK